MLPHSRPITDAPLKTLQAWYDESLRQPPIRIPDQAE